MQLLFKYVWPFSGHQAQKGQTLRLINHLLWRIDGWWHDIKLFAKQCHPNSKFDEQQIKNVLGKKLSVKMHSGINQLRSNNFMTTSHPKALFLVTCNIWLLGLRKWLQLCHVDQKQLFLIKRLVFRNYKTYSRAWNPLFMGLTLS